jgi:uncharacterized membrane protein YbhN (UPF0104 family)
LSTLLRRTLYAVVAGILLYVAAVLWLDVQPLRDALAGYPWSLFAIALALSSGNYLLRFSKWELSLHWLHVREQAPGLTRGRSLLVYLAGLSMSVTPGKVGEVLRSMLLRASDGVPFTRTAPIVVADRLTDLVALVLLAAVGVAERPEYLPVLVVTVVLVGAGVLVLGSPRLLGGALDLAARVPSAGSLVARARPLVDSSVTLMRRGPLLWLTLLSVAGWGLECIGFWLLHPAGERRHPDRGARRRAARSPGYTMVRRAGGCRRAGDLPARSGRAKASAGAGRRSLAGFEHLGPTPT